MASTSTSNEIQTITIPPESSSKETKSHCSFTLTKKLGEGTFGTVRLGINVETGEQVAVKILEKVKILQLEDKTRVENEIKILKCLRHANIVHLYSVVQTDTAIYLIMEYIHGKELFDYIIENRKLDELEACKFFQQIISGVEYLHKLKVVHRDLKPENLLLDTKTKDLKIVDFGLSNLYKNTKNQMLKSACGSPSYAAPEMLNGKEYKAPPVDIWSSGVILYAMLCGYLPFEDDDNEELYKKICSGKFTIPAFISEPAKDLIKKILVTDPSHRIGIYQIKNHPWFNLLNPTLNINEGLLINQIVIPLDENVINEMVKKFGFENKEEIRASVLSNRHNDIATIYYLIMRRRMREGKKSIADLKSNLFLKYIRDKANLFERYNFDFDKVIIDRKDGIKKDTEKKKESSNANTTLPSTAQTDKQSKQSRKQSHTTSPFADTLSKRHFNLRTESNNIKPLKQILTKVSTTKPKLIYINTSNKGYKSPIGPHKQSLSLNVVPTLQNKTETSPSLPIILKTTEPNPIDLSCLSFKPKSQIKETIINALDSIRIRYRAPSGRIIIENFKENNFKMEIKIVEVNDIENCHSIKFRRILGNMDTYTHISRRILKRLVL